MDYSVVKALQRSKGLGPTLGSLAHGSSREENSPELLAVKTRGDCGRIRWRPMGVADIPLKGSMRESLTDGLSHTELQC